MKLRTDVVDGKVRPSMHSGYDVEHDLLAARALLQAMDETRFLFKDSPATMDQVKQRAAEILAGWIGEDRNG